MSGLPVALGVVSVLALASLAMSLAALAGAARVLRAARENSSAARERTEPALAALCASIEELQARLDELERRPAALPAMPKAGLNLGKRSQALRMHRRGDAPDQIARALELPVTEVELLIKVQRIVLSSL
jgi:hypothetical protein